mgnify:CR=1 FL=1
MNMPQKPSGKEVSMVRSSAAEYLTFVAVTGGGSASVEMRYEDENLWLTQKIDVARQRVPGAPPLAAERESGEEAEEQGQRVADRAADGDLRRRQEAQTEGAGRHEQVPALAHARPAGGCGGAARPEGAGR